MKVEFFDGQMMTMTARALGLVSRRPSANDDAYEQGGLQEYVEFEKLFFGIRGNHDQRYYDIIDFLKSNRMRIRIWDDDPRCPEPYTFTDCMVISCGEPVHCEEQLMFCVPHLQFTHSRSWGRENERFDFGVAGVAAEHCAQEMARIGRELEQAFAIKGKPVFADEVEPWLIRWRKP